ncbi:hypothetical protein AVEN_221625-1, partial [Araneus ventricosus]
MLEKSNQRQFCSNKFPKESQEVRINASMEAL